jgi:GNAT superfamily N-acetyltransferase
VLKLEKVDRALLCTEIIQESHIPDLVELWRGQYQKMVKTYDYLPHLWLDDTSSLAQFIESHVDQSSGVVTRLGNIAIGFMVYDAFEFYGEPTAFFPIMGHAAVEAYKLVTYSEMYNSLSQILVDKGYLSHIVTYFALDERLQQYLYELGFGLFVVDGFRDLQPVPAEAPPRDIEVRRARAEDIDALCELVEESASYYFEAPLFITKEAEGKQAVHQMVRDDAQAVFIAIKGDALVGFTNVRQSDGNDVYTLCDRATARIDPLGAYIKKDYRGSGIGKWLLQEVVAWCSQQNITTIHVDFESANYHANQFWLKYFDPALYSVKRRLNSDVL